MSDEKAIIVASKADISLPSASPGPAECSNTPDEPPVETIVFKTIKRKKNLRTAKVAVDDNGAQDGATSNDEASAEVDRSIMEDTRELQRLRKRQKGVSVASLIVGKTIPAIVEKTSDPFKMETGGLVEMKAAKKADTINIGNQFASETNERDEDADMMKYIEEELKKRKGDAAPTEEEPKHLSLKNEDLLMQILPKHLKQAGNSKSEEMLSNQMLAGIPEVDLGIDERIRNIEATEEAKMRMLRDRVRTVPKEESMAPVNFSVNFAQQQEARRPRVHRDYQYQNHREPGQPLRASDDMRVERFKKHFSRR
ncbi:uncharacterized protein C9orf78 homolog [Varroa jacobsoni]|uniref:uncharacterized protein C9orf78 homolog n=1 Tax=Varroa jacobsoni TaxID=62625 RepID=UPI000BF9BF43|nr:uncharacterized protein C9orf78 homolog [Varroa jacobsoni]